MAQEPHKSAFEGNLRDAAYYAINDTIRAKKLETVHVYPKVRHNAFKHLKNGASPNRFSLSALLRFAEALSCKGAVHQAICSAGA